MRIACLHVPAFPLQALRRATPELAEACLGVAAGPTPRDPLVAVSAEAAECGVRAGMTAAQARQRAPQVMIKVVPAEVAAAADEALADVAASFSPRCRRHLPGETLLDVGGLLPRFGSEARLAHEMLRACRRVGLDARVGIAACVGVARVAAHFMAAEGVRGAAGLSASVVVAAGAEGSFMAPLPLDLLEPSPAAALALGRWGVRTAGALAALPRREVAQRLGREGLRLHRLAAGEESDEFVPDPIREVLREGVAVEHPLATLEPFLFVLRGLLSRLAERLALRGQGFADVLLELALEGGERRELRVALVAPTPEVATVLALARLQVEAAPPGAAVEGVTVRVAPGRVPLAQGSLFDPPRPAPGKLAAALVRLAALVGPGRIGAPIVPDTHRPGAWGVAPFLPGQRGEREEGRGKSKKAGGGPDPGARSPVPVLQGGPVLRAMRPPGEAQVVTAGGRPVVARVGGLGGAVVGCAGPYRFAGEWWGDEPFARDDFDVATADGALLRVYFDRRQRRWFVDGIYD